MGVLVPGEKLQAGELPKENAQLMALGAIFRRLESINEFGGSFGVGFQAYGSSTTGNAGIRGDLDGIVFYARIKDGEYVRSHGENEVVAQEMFEKGLRKMVDEVAVAHRVTAEFRFVSLIDALEGMAPEVNRDLIFLDHIRSSPGMWRVDAPLSVSDNQGQLIAPLDVIFSQGIDIHEPLEPWEVSKVASTVYRYMTAKAKYFAGELQQMGGVEPNLKALQRSLEFAKACTRKLMAFVAVTQPEHIDAKNKDVTSKRHMYAQFEQLAVAIDSDGRAGLWRYCRYLIAMNAEYDALLEEVKESRDIERYNAWIQESYAPALEAAYYLAAACWKHVDDTLWQHLDIEIENFDLFDTLYRLPAIDDPIKLIDDPSYV